MCKRNTFALNACEDVHVNIGDGSEERLEEAGGHRDDVRGVEAQKGDEFEADNGFRVLFLGASEWVRGVNVKLMQGGLLCGSMQKIGLSFGRWGITALQTSEDADRNAGPPSIPT